MSGDQTFYDKVIVAFKNNVFVVVIMIFIIIITAVATLTDSIAKVTSFFGSLRDAPKADPISTRLSLNSDEKTSEGKDRSIVSSPVGLWEEEPVANRLNTKVPALTNGELSVNTIIRTFRDAPASRYSQMQDYFVGQKIDWSLYLGAVRQTKYGYFVGALPLDPSHTEPMITFFVPLEGNEKLNLAVEGDTIRIRGKLREANQFKVWIEDVELVSLRSKTHNARSVIQPPL